MKVERSPSFRRDLRRVTDREAHSRVQEKIAELKAATTLFEVTNVRRLAGQGRYYRIRIGDYRLGIALERDMVVLVRFGPRSDFYRYFP